MLNIYLCPSPELYPLYHRAGASVIITDILRATTTMTTAIASGAVGIMPVASIEEAQYLGAAHGYLMAAERNVRRCEFADLGNDPQEYTPDRVEGKEIVMTTTNGTRALSIARSTGASDILIGSFNNLSATLEYCVSLGLEEVVVLAAGWQGQVSSEDTLYAGALAYTAEQKRIGRAMDDMARMMRDLWSAYCTEPTERIDYIKHSEHYSRLLATGYDDTIPYCLAIDTHPIAIGLEQIDSPWLVRKENANLHK